jgi:hypothetical protein
MHKLIAIKPNIEIILTYVNGTRYILPPSRIIEVITIGAKPPKIEKPRL